MGYETRGHYGWPAFIAAERPGAEKGVRFSRMPDGALYIGIYQSKSNCVLTAEERRGLLAWLKEQFPEDAEE